jgi:hypothetical protein
VRWPPGADGATPAVRRDVACAATLVRPFARWMLRREAAALAAVGARGAPRARVGVPRLLYAGRDELVRGWIEGRSMHARRPHDPAWFGEARRLLVALHRAGVTHNDAAKEPNWLVRAGGGAALVDFQLACVHRRRGRCFRLLAREDLRHLAKHKRTCCPAALTPRERALVARPSWPARWLRAGPKRLYNLVTRRLLGWEDDEGARRRRNA